MNILELNQQLIKLTSEGKGDYEVVVDVNDVDNLIRLEQIDLVTFYGIRIDDNEKLVYLT